MPTRSLLVGDERWDVFPSGFVTQYSQDEFGLIFVRGTGAGRVQRVTRYSPQGARSREQSLAELTDDQLRELFATSQPSFTSPELKYQPTGQGGAQGGVQGGAPGSNRAP